MSDWTTFNETHVYPAMFDRIDEILPEFGFVDGGTVTGEDKRTYRVKKSRIHVNDLTRDKEKELVTYLYDNGQCGLFDHARKTSASTADVYARLHNMDWQAAMAEITERLGLSHLAPKPTGHYDDSPEAARKRAMAEFASLLQEERDQAQEIFTRRLWDDAAKPSGKDTVLAFMKGRGWTEGHIRAAGLGMYVNAMNGDLPEGLAMDLEKQRETIGNTHILTIPYHAYGRIYSFGFRHLGGPGTEHLKNKYTNVQGVPLKYLVGIRRGVQHAIIVEGWLDYLAARVRGVDNVFATITATASVKMLDDAIDNARVREFTLMLDNDIAGITGARKVIEHLRERGIPCYIGRYPQDVKDLDEFFNVKGGTVEEFTGIVNNAESGHTFATEIIIRSTVSNIYQATNGQKYQPREIDDATAAAFVKEHATPRQREKLRNDIVSHLTATPPAERLEALRCMPAWANAFKLDEPSLLEASTGEEAQRRRREEEEANKKFEASFMKASKALRKGDIALAKKLTAEAAAAAVPRPDASDMIILSSLEKLRAHAREMPAGILTGYTFKENKESNPRETRLRLKPGLTFISAPTSHGKTSFLNNITINVARRTWLEYQAALDKFEEAEREGNAGDLKRPKVRSVFYVTLEEEADVLQAKLLNVFCNDEYINPDNQDEAILDWFRNGTPENRHPLFYEQLAIGDPDTAKDQYDRFCAKAEEFGALLKSGTLAFCEKGHRLEDLISVINTYMDKYDTALICIDFVQMVSPEGETRDRYLQIKKVVTELAVLAKHRKTPFLLASQFNRKVVNPLEIRNDNAGEGGDIERIADIHIGIYNLTKLKRIPKSGEHSVDKKEIQELLAQAYVPKGWPKRTEWEYGEAIEGYMFATLLKCRGGLSELDIILPFNGPTRKIALNDLAYCEEIDEDTPLPPATGDVRGAGRPRQAPRPSGAGYGGAGTGWPSKEALEELYNRKDDEGDLPFQENEEEDGF